jgi:polysaccharide deacetylase family protein (PEP-CTERM system associated)
MAEGRELPVAGVRNAFSVDVEDWFQVAAFDPYLPRSGWGAQPCRIERNLMRMLALLDAHAVKATFFTLGWIARRYPALVRAIVDAGHELASHGYGHARVDRLTPAEFAADLAQARAWLEGASGQPVRGYRAPTFSIPADSGWFYEALAASGHDYSSSLAPIRHDSYGMPDASRQAYRASSGVLEIPISTVRLAGRNFSCAGGGFFRLYPYALFRWGLRRINEHDGLPGMFFIHPWEIDPGQPRMTAVPVKTRFRHYLNLSRVEARLHRLLADFSWARVDEVFL